MPTLPAPSPVALARLAQVAATLPVRQPVEMRGTAMRAAPEHVVFQARCDCGPSPATAPASLGKGLRERLR